MPARDQRTVHADLPRRRARRPGPQGQQQRHCADPYHDGCNHGPFLPEMPIDRPKEHADSKNRKPSCASSKVRCPHTAAAPRRHRFHRMIDAAQRPFAAAITK